MNETTDLFRIRLRDVAKVVVLGLVQAAALVTFVLLLMVTVDALGADPLGAAAEAAWRTTMFQLGLLVLTVLLYGCLRAWEFSLAEKIGYDLVRRLRMRLYGHLQGMTPRQLQHRARGGLILRFVGDLSMLRMWISHGLLGGFVALVVLTVTLGALFVLNVRIGLALTAVLAVGAAISLASGRRMRQATRIMRRRRSVLTSNLDEQLNALPVVQLFGRSGGEYSRLSRQNDSLNRALCRVAELRGRLRGISSTFALLSIVAVLAVGLVEVRHGTATVGLVIAAVVLSRLLATPVRVLGLAHDYWHRSRVSRQKLLEFLHSSSRPLDPPDAVRLRVRRGRVQFVGVTVPGALDDVTLTAEPGRLVAVTGPVGAGKSTLLGLMARQVEPTAGEVIVDGQRLAETSPRSTFQQIGVVGPDLPLMRGTVRRNLTYAAPGADAAEVARVVNAVGLDLVLAELPAGLTTWVVEGGRNLSAGQRQRIALGRALLGNPPLLLLDEPTAQLDPGSRADVRRMLARQHGTVLLVTQDPDEIALADDVWVLDRGRVVETMTGHQWRDRHWWASRNGNPQVPLATG
jgi:ABC-type multidrug transport system fused ATPase/permease subunit